MTKESHAGSAGYSGSPLVKKLGIKEDFRVLLIDAPRGYKKHLSSLPNSVRFVSEPNSTVDLVQLFVTDREALRQNLMSFRKRLSAKAAIWISWPKKSSKVPTTVLEGTIRELALPMGFVDVKVCAVTEVWSGLKLVVRKELR